MISQEEKEKLKKIYLDRLPKFKQSDYPEARWFKDPSDYDYVRVANSIAESPNFKGRSDLCIGYTKPVKDSDGFYHKKVFFLHNRDLGMPKEKEGYGRINKIYGFPSEAVRFEKDNLKLEEMRPVYIKGDMSFEMHLKLGRLLKETRLHCLTDLHKIKTKKDQSKSHEKKIVELIDSLRNHLEEIMYKKYYQGLDSKERDDLLNVYYNIPESRRCDNTRCLSCFENMCSDIKGKTHCKSYIIK